MTDTYNLCSDCRDTQLVTAQEEQTGICLTCWQDMGEWLFETTA